MNFRFFIFFSLFSSVCYSQNLLPELVKKVKPAVVNITLFESNGYESEGTGFFIDEKGICVSAYHVLDNAENITIETSDGKKYEFDSILAADKKSDIVKFCIKNSANEKFSFLKLASTPPEEGEAVFMIGSPLGHAFSVTSGIVSALRNDEHGKQVQTTTPTGQGSSGSPLMNMNGEVIGVMSHVKYVTQNMSFAADVSHLKEIQDDGSLHIRKTNTTPLSPHQIDKLIDKAQDIFKNNDYDSALTVLFPLFRDDLSEMQQINIMWNAGSCYFMKRDYQNSFTYFDRTIDLLYKKSAKTPEMIFIYTEALHKAGMCQYYIGLKEDAMKTIEKSIEVSKVGLENDLFRKDLYITMLQIGYYSLGIIKLDFGDSATACLNFKLSKEFGYDKVEAEIEKWCEKEKK